MTKRKVGTVWPASSREIVNENRRWPGITRSSRILKQENAHYDDKNILTMKIKIFSKNLAVVECWSFPQSVDTGDVQQDV